jgi:hypothetical protein
MKIIERQLITTTARAISNIFWNNNLLQNTSHEELDDWDSIFESIEEYIEIYGTTSEQETEICHDFFIAFLSDFFLNGGFEDDPMELSLLALRALTCCEVFKENNPDFESRLIDLSAQWRIEYSIDDLEKLIKYQLPTQH